MTLDFSGKSSPPHTPHDNAFEGRSLFKNLYGPSHSNQESIETTLPLHTNVLNRGVGQSTGVMSTNGIVIKTDAWKIGATETIGAKAEPLGRG